MPETDQRRGVAAGVAAYGLWGLFPLYFHHLRAASALEILSHRILWSLVVTLAIVLATRGRRPPAAVRWTPQLAGRVTLAAVLIAVNWLVYTWAVNHDHVVEAALGYFVNPLVTVALGVVVLGERLRRLQWAAVGLGVVSVVVLTVALGRPPWISLVLALSFAGYGFLKKQVPLPAVRSLLAETAVLAPAALVTVVVLAAQDTAAFGRSGEASTTALLVIAGPVTTIPLVLFAAAARRIPLTLLGLLQYLTPVGQFLCGVLVFHERLTPARWAGFVLVWGALALLSADALLGRDPGDLERDAHRT